MADPARNPQSQALVFPPDDPGLAAVQSELIKQREVLNGILDLLLTAVPSGFHFPVIERLREKLNS